MPATAQPHHARRTGAGAAKKRTLTREEKGIALFLLAAGLSFLLSVGLWFAGSREEGVFVGLWVPSILAAGAFWIAAVRTRSGA